MKFLEDIPLITFKKREKKKKTRDNKINHMNKESVWSPLYLTENHIKVGRSYTLNLGARQHHRIIQPAAAPRDHSCALICGQSLSSSPIALCLQASRDKCSGTHKLRLLNYDVCFLDQILVLSLFKGKYDLVYLQNAIVGPSFYCQGRKSAESSVMERDLLVRPRTQNKKI